MIVTVAACRRSTGPSLHQLRVQDDIVDADKEEDSNCCSMMEMSTAASSSVSLQHCAAVTVSQTDTGYQSNIMQITGGQDMPLSTTTSAAGT